MVELISLFTAAFLAATLVPLASELGLAALVLDQPDRVWLFVLVASVGNTLGSVVNWILGRFAAFIPKPKWWPISERDQERAHKWFNRYGKYSLLAAWVPVIGDPLTFIAGALRVPFWWFLALVAISKTGRYLVVVGLVLAGESQF